MKRKNPHIMKQPEDQSFEDGISITMDMHTYNPITGQRDKKVGKQTARFKHAHKLATFWEQNRRRINKKGKNENKGKDS